MHEAHVCWRLIGYGSGVCVCVERGSPYNPDTNGTEESPRISEVCELDCMQELFLGKEKVS